MLIKTKTMNFIQGIGISKMNLSIMPNILKEKSFIAIAMTIMGLDWERLNQILLSIWRIILKRLGLKN